MAPTPGNNTSTAVDEQNNLFDRMDEVGRAMGFFQRLMGFLPVLIFMAVGGYFLMQHEGFRNWVGEMLNEHPDMKLGVDRFLTGLGLDGVFKNNVDRSVAEAEWLKRMPAEEAREWLQTGDLKLSAGLAAILTSRDDAIDNPPLADDAAWQANVDTLLRASSSNLRTENILSASSIYYIAKQRPELAQRLARNMNSAGNANSEATQRIRASLQQIFQNDAYVLDLFGTAERTDTLEILAAALSTNLPLEEDKLIDLITAVGLQDNGQPTPEFRSFLTKVLAGDESTYQSALVDLLCSEHARGKAADISRLLRGVVITDNPDLQTLIGLVDQPEKLQMLYICYDALGGAGELSGEKLVQLTALMGAGGTGLPISAELVRLVGVGADGKPTAEFTTFLNTVLAAGDDTEARNAAMVDLVCSPSLRGKANEIAGLLQSATITDEKLRPLIVLLQEPANRDFFFTVYDGLGSETQTGGAKLVQLANALGTGGLTAGGVDLLPLVRTISLDIENKPTPAFSIFLTTVIDGGQGAVPDGFLTLLRAQPPEKVEELRVLLAGMDATTIAANPDSNLDEVLKLAIQTAPNKEIFEAQIAFFRTLEPNELASLQSLLIPAGAVDTAAAPAAATAIDITQIPPSLASKLQAYAATVDQENIAALPPAIGSLVTSSHAMDRAGINAGELSAALTAVSAVVSLNDLGIPTQFGESESVSLDTDRLLTALLDKATRDKLRGQEDNLGLILTAANAVDGNVITRLFSTAESGHYPNLTALLDFGDAIGQNNANRYSLEGLLSPATAGQEADQAALLLKQQQIDHVVFAIDRYVTTHETNLLDDIFTHYPEQISVFVDHVRASREGQLTLYDQEVLSLLQRAAGNGNAEPFYSFPPHYTRNLMLPITETYPSLRTTEVLSVFIDYAQGNVDPSRQLSREMLSSFFAVPGNREAFANLIHELNANDGALSAEAQNFLNVMDTNWAGIGDALSRVNGAEFILKKSRGETVDWMGAWDWAFNPAVRDNLDPLTTLGSAIQQLRNADSSSAAEADPAASPQPNINEQTVIASQTVTGPY